MFEPEASWDAWIDQSSGVLKVQGPDGQIKRLGRVTGRDGQNARLPAVGFAESDDGIVLELTYPDGRKVSSKPLRHGITPVKGEDYFDGEPGRTPVKGKDYFDGEPGRTPVKGKDYFDGETGPCGPPPRHQWGDQVDPPRKATEIRFELERAQDGSVAVWGQWRDIGGKPGRKGADRLGGGYVNRQLVEQIVSTSAVTGYKIADEDPTKDIKFYGYTHDTANVWYIVKVSNGPTSTTYRYCNSGAANYAAAWAARESLEYLYRYEVTL